MPDASDPTSRVYIDHHVTEKVPTVAVSGEHVTSEAKEHKKNNPPVISIPRKIAAIGMDFLETIVVALSIFVVVYLFLVQPHEVKGSSMEPTFHNNEYILTDKISYRLADPQRGDIVIFKAPNNPEVDYIKRIIGSPGDTVKIDGGEIYINGARLDERYLTQTTLLIPGGSLHEGSEIAIPPDTFFVMGDNRGHSSDSREFGPIERSSIIGRAFLRYWPLNVAGIIHSFNYEISEASDKSS